LSRLFYSRHSLGLFTFDFSIYPSNPFVQHRLRRHYTPNVPPRHISCNEHRQLAHSPDQYSHVQRNLNFKNHFHLLSKCPEQLHGPLPAPAASRHLVRENAQLQRVESARHQIQLLFPWIRTTMTRPCPRCTFTNHPPSHTAGQGVH
jgi:hypothetical protein